MNQINQPYIGMKLGVHPASLKQGEYKYLLNGLIQAIDGKYLKITNEQSNILCTRFKPGFVVINSTFVPSLNITFFFLVNPTTNESEIGVVTNTFNKDTLDREVPCTDCKEITIPDTPLELTTQTESCTYTTYVNADCLAFNINKPVRTWVKVDDCNVRIYFADDLNDLRYIDYTDYQKEELLTCPPIYSDTLDCNKIKIFPDTCYPKIKYTDVVSGGQNTAGTYQFAVAYADANGNAMSSYFFVTNPIPLSSRQLLQDTNTAYPVAKSIKLLIEDIHPDFKFFNIVVLQTTNLNTTPYLVGTFSNSGETFEYLYTGQNKNQLQTSIDTILARKPFYKQANIVAESNGYLLFGDVKQERPLNLQPYFLNLPVYWQTVELNEGDYGNPIIAANYRGFLGDEVYPIAIELVKTNGTSSARFHIAGRAIKPSDEEIINNADVFLENSCVTELRNKRWQVYNTASLTSFACNYNPTIQASEQTTFYSCDSPLYYYDTINDVYYATYNYSTNEYSDPIDPDDYCECPDCVEEAEQAYNSPNYQNLTLVGTDCETVVVESESTVEVPVYNPNPTIDPYTPPSVIPSPPAAAITCNLAQPISGGATPCDAPFYTQTDSGVTSEYWFSLGVSSDPLFVLFNSSAVTYDIDVYTSTGTCSSLVLDSTYTSINQQYILLQGYDLGSLLYFRVYNATPDNETFSVCVGIPAPSGYTTVTLPRVENKRCNVEMTYTVSTKYNPCTPANYQYGEMAYWESETRYPCNPEVWGDLADKPIRHHKFPDFKISPFYSHYGFVPDDLGQPTNAYYFNQRNKIYPKGLRISVKDIKNALIAAESDGKITREERLDICGYRILRGDRNGNQSIVGKGLIYDVWWYTDNTYSTGDRWYYPNYPYNDLRPDLFLSSVKIDTLSEVIQSHNPTHPYTDKSNNKYTFHSPETSFNNPALGSELKLEALQYGVSRGKFTKVKDHAEYQYAGAGAIIVAMSFAGLEGVVGAVERSTQADGVVMQGLYQIAASADFTIGSINAYYEWLDVIKKLAPFRNFAYYFNSIGNYVSYIETEEGFTRRFLEVSQYLQPGIVSIDNLNTSTNYTFNNLDRESSVYLQSAGTNFPAPGIEDTSRWIPGKNGVTCEDLGNKYNGISSYYASVKNFLPSQYGDVLNIEYIDTGYNGVIDWDDSNQDTVCNPVFGGDTFIGRFALKRKLRYFLEDAVGKQPNSDIQYGTLGNVWFPQYFFNYPTTAEANATTLSLFGDVATVSATKVDYNFSCPDYSQGYAWIIGMGGAIALGSAAMAVVAGAAPGATVWNIGIITISALFDVNPFNEDKAKVYLDGKVYLYSYGIPSFLTESSINLDLRHGENTKEKDFYPNVGDVTKWTQEVFVPISEDNYYLYNQTYSKQNRENFGYTLNRDFNQEKEDCKADNPNRVIYSLQDNDSNDRVDGNLVFLANNYFDFSKAGGKLKIIKGFNNNSVLVVQEDQASLFNSFVTLQTSIGATAVGSNTLFSQQPAQYIKTDLGYGGSQTSAVITTEFGTFWVDNKRGNILSLQSQLESIIQPEDEQWFKTHLPFRILNYFPEVNIDNPYKDFGMLIVYDHRFKRVIFTKKDYAPLVSKVKNMTFSDNQFYYTANNQTVLIQPTDSQYFEDVSWTISYSPITKTFTSFHSYTPNYYTPNHQYFSSGNLEGLWNHNLTNKSYQVFYGKLYPFLLEYNTKQTIPNSVLNDISYMADFNRYVDSSNSYLNETVTYNKALVYNQNQSTGNLVLVLKNKENLNQLLLQGTPTANGIVALVENVENYWKINYMFDKSLHNNQPLLLSTETIPYSNPQAISMSQKFMEDPLRGDYFQLRFVNDDKSNYQIIHKLSISNQL